MENTLVSKDTLGQLLHIMEVQALILEQLTESVEKLATRVKRLEDNLTWEGDRGAP